MARRGSASGPTGFVVVDKEEGWTSHDVVAKLRGVLRQRRIGHAGTLDPSATGVLIIGLGSATRLLRFIQTSTKYYEGSLQLGSTTTTLDADGEVVATFVMDHVTSDEVVAATMKLTGDLMQVPPMVSAIRVEGRRLHELAREGIEIERAPRPVSVERFIVEPTESPLLYRFAVTCSTGTYVRSLVDDLGRLLGGGAHMASLRRVGIGTFSLDQAHRLEQIEEAAREGNFEDSGIMLSLNEALIGLEDVSVTEEDVLRVCQGAVFSRQEYDGQRQGPFRFTAPNGDLLAIYERHGVDRVKPSVVLVAPPALDEDKGAQAPMARD